MTIIRIRVTIYIKLLISIINSSYPHNWQFTGYNFLIFGFKVTIFYLFTYFKSYKKLLSYKFLLKYYL